MIIRPECNKQHPVSFFTYGYLAAMFSGAFQPGYYAVYHHFIITNDRLRYRSVQNYLMIVLTGSERIELSYSVLETDVLAIEPTSYYILLQ